MKLSTLKTTHKNNIFTLLNKNKKKFSPLLLTPLLAACEGFTITINPVSQSLIDAANAANMTIHISPLTQGDVFGGTNDDDAIFGSNYADNLSGDIGDDEIHGYGGDDALNGNSGDDKIWGGDGADHINGGTGADKLYGEDGIDVIDPGNDLEIDFIDGGAGYDTLTYASHSIGKLTININNGSVNIGGNGSDSFINIENITGVLNAQNELIGDGIANHLIGGNLADFIAGNGGDDLIEGKNGNDDLDGGAGNDIIKGGAGEDEIKGGSGDDEIEGNEGVDTIIGGQGSDKLTGGSGDDIFKFTNDDALGGNSTDTITDFSTNDDFLNFAQLDYINNFADLTGNMLTSQGDTIIYLDAAHDHKIIIENVDHTSLSSSDFVFA